MAANGISTLSTKELRQKSKLDLAASKRDNAGHPRATYDITQLPTQYNNNDVIDNPNTGGLVGGRPWIPTSSFTVYEEFNTISAIETTQYASGNKIYVYSSSFDVPGYQNARVVVNDIEVLNTSARGHNMVVLDTYGNTLSTANYDTYGDSGAVTSLANALNSVSNGSIVILTVYDASALDSNVRSALATGFGATATNTWTSSRVDHIFIGIKV